MTDDVRAIGANVALKNVVPRVEFELNEEGKHNALRMSAEAVGVSESAVLDLNV